ncbi:MAG: glycosyltransferase family 2 protein, partial [Bryobacteraceae bacterium]
THRPLDVVVVDNASTDATRKVLGDFDGRVRVIHNERNDGFAAAQNLAIASTRSDWVLTLNPDVQLMPGFIDGLVEAGEIDRRAGTVCGKLLRIGRDLAPPSDVRIDSTGIFFTPSMRHFDRGWNEPDDGRFDDLEYVFGASAAAALYRRKMIDDISTGGEFFDSDFFTYREDADVAWRSQLLGWRCLYNPEACGHHVRTMKPGSRRSVPPVLNMHSVKNRFLMRVKNVTADLYRQHWIPVTGRDVVVLGGCLLYEPSSLPAFWHFARGLRRALANRQTIMLRRKVSDEYLAGWFRSQPSAEPLAQLTS